MPGATSQLALVGAQNRFLNYNAQSSFFVSYHTTYEDFAIEPLLVIPQGNLNFGQQTQFNIPSGGDMICGAALEVTLPALTAPNGYDIAWIHMIGIYMFRYIEFKAGTVLLDTHHAQFMDLFSRLMISKSQEEGWNDMIGNINLITRFVNGNTVVPNAYRNDSPQLLASSKPQFTVLVPLMFWWCLDYAMSLTVGVLIYTTMSIIVYMRNANEVYIQSAGSPALSVQPSIVSANLWVDFVFLDEPARVRLAKQSSFYVIKQIQYPGPIAVNSPNLNYKMPFMMPVAELIMGVQEDAAIAANVRRFDWWDRYTGNANNLPDEPISQIEIKINGTKRLETRGYLYHARYQPFKHHTSIPSTRGIMIFSFALFPEQSDASGAANFSRTDNKYINFIFNTADGNGIGNVTGNIHLFAISLNYIFIENGFLTLIYNV